MSFHRNEANEFFIICLLLVFLASYKQENWKLNQIDLNKFTLNANKNYFVNLFCMLLWLWYLIFKSIKCFIAFLDN